MKFFLTALISVLLLAGVVQVQSQQAGDQSNIPAEEYAIYAAVIGDMFVGGKDSLDPQSRVKMLVIEDRTVSNTFAAIAGEDERKRLKQGFSSIISQEAIDDYVAKNVKSHQLTKSFDLKLKYTLIPKEKIDQIFKDGPGGWGEFYLQFPDSVGLITLSRAGLDSSGNQAVVYIAHSCGGLCGSGN
ncbi:MAG TPA: hypothetical protein VG324_01305, partial [Blastocatellia bacterium]|nr:hypothetical protein [Blastocatellia bacterium]